MLGNIHWSTPQAIEWMNERMKEWIQRSYCRDFLQVVCLKFCNNRISMQIELNVVINKNKYNVIKIWTVFFYNFIKFCLMLVVLLKYYMVLKIVLKFECHNWHKNCPREHKRLPSFSMFSIRFYLVSRAEVWYVF